MRWLPPILCLQDTAAHVAIGDSYHLEAITPTKNMVDSEEQQAIGEESDGHHAGPVGVRPWIVIGACSIGLWSIV